MTHKGYLFEQEISRSLREEDSIWYYRFPQLKRAKHPFDHLVITPDEEYAIEEKKTERKSFPFKELRDKQEKSLLWFQKLRNNTSYVFINFRHGRGKIRAFSLSIEEYLYTKNQMMIEKKRKSVPLGYLEESDRVREMDRIRINDNYGWDLKFLSKQEA